MNLTLTCTRCGAERDVSKETYCLATRECAWYAAQFHSGEVNRKAMQHQIVRYPDWGRDWIVPMPMILEPRMGTLVQDLVLANQAQREWDHPLFVGDALLMLSSVVTSYTEPGTRDNPIEVEVDGIETADKNPWMKRMRASATAYAAVSNPGYPNPRKALSGRHVLIRGVRYRVLGVECYAVFLPYHEGMHFGLYLEGDDGQAEV